MKNRISSEMAYPLHWPEGRDRVVSWKREKARFKVCFGAARDNVLDELRKLGARYVVISTNIPTRLDGLPYASQATPTDPAVAVYFDYKSDAHVFACDKWTKVEHNLHAIGKTVEALRGIKRWGSADMMKRAVNAFKALPDQPAADDWRRVLGFAPNGKRPELEEVKAKYREKAMRYHSDRGGNEDEMKRINIAWEAAQKELG